MSVVEPSSKAPVALEDYGVGVKFERRGVWSKPYTYRSSVPYMPGDAVIVPMGSFYAIGKVVNYQKGYDFNPDLVYKRILRKVMLDD